MTPEKWKELMDESSFVEKPFLYLHRLYFTRPWWIYGLFLAFCGTAFANSYSNLKESDELLPVFLFLVGFGPIFFFFSFKLMLWIVLRFRGIPAEYLKIE